MGVTFEHPAWLLLILGAIPVAWAGLRWFAPMSRIRRVSAVVLRVLLISLISAMLAGASSIRRTDRIAVVGILDVSGSVRMFADFGPGPDAKPLDPLRAAREYFAAVASQRTADDLIGLVVFDGRSLAVATPTRGPIADRSLDVRMTEGTNIADALRYAAALIPPDASGRLVLLSDGNQTAGDAAAAARELASRSGARVPIDVIPIPLSASREVMVESVDAPPRAAVESTVTVRVVLRASAAARGTLSLLREGEPLDINGAEPGYARRVQLAPGPNVELINVQLPPGKVHRFVAVFEPQREGETLIGDTRLENNQGEAFTVTPGRGSVLLVDGVGNAQTGSPGLILASTLRESGIVVSEVPPEGIPGNVLALEAYDLVILENVPAEAVPAATQEALVAHVRDLGGGLVMIGGPDSLGAGGWKGSALEPILPVKLDLPEQLVQPDAAVVFVIDNSGSMGRPVSGTPDSQQEIANASTALAIRTLDKKDLVGVVVFNSQTDVLVPLGPNTDPKAITERVLSITAGGGTIMGPALREAQRQLHGVKAAVKHVIVLSDGQSMGADSLPGIAARMKAEDGITLSTIGVGNEMDGPTMGQMAQRGGGQFFAVTNPALLPKYFLKAIRVIRTPLIREGRFQPVILPTASPLTAGLDTPKPLTGLVLTQRRPEPTITYAMAAPTGEPLLAHWNVELGQVAVFTSDAHRWAADWLQWPGYSELWTRIARTISRVERKPGRYELSTEIRADTIRIRLEASGDDGRPLDRLTVPATIYAPSGRATEITLSQVGPGTYEAAAPVRESGSHVAILKPRLGNRPLDHVIGGAASSTGPEFRSLTTNTPLLEAIARETGGRTLDIRSPREAKLFDRTGMPPSLARTPLWSSLLLWTLLVLLLDVATRRIAWDRFVSREFGVDLRKVAAEAVRERGREAAATVERLRTQESATARAEEPSAALSDEDARQLVEAERLRRHQARVQAMREIAQAETSPPDAPVVQPPARAAESDEGGLLAAKRRARARFEGDSEDAANHPS